MVVIEHQEYILDLISGAANTFDLQQFAINPGQSFLFPWLSTIAGNYVHYAFEYLELVFVSTSAVSLSSTTNQQMGVAGFRPVSDPTLPVDVSLIQILNTSDKVVSVPFKSFKCTFPCSMSTKYLTIRTGAQPSGTDLRMYDPGYFEAFTAAIPAPTQDIGQLHVRYKVHLMKPQYIQGLIGYTVRAAHYQSPSGVSQGAMFGTITAGVPNLAAVTGNAMTMTFTSVASTSHQIVFPVEVTTGRFLVLIAWSCNGSTFVAPVLSTVTNGSQPSSGFPTPNSTAFAVGNFSGPTQAAAATMMAVIGFFIDVAAPGSSQCSMNFAGTFTASALLGTCDVKVVQWNGLMY